MPTSLHTCRNFFRHVRRGSPSMPVKYFRHVSRASPDMPKKFGMDGVLGTCRNFRHVSRAPPAMPKLGRTGRYPHVAPRTKGRTSALRRGLRERVYATRRHSSEVPRVRLRRTSPDRPGEELTVKFRSKILSSGEVPGTFIVRFGSRTMTSTRR